VASRRTALIVVPGGGAFADAVREADRRLGLGDDAAHWMAVLAMDQCAHLLLTRLAIGALVSTARDIEVALQAGKVAILAPYRWLRAVDPLPHSWSVTSDAIAAWVAGAAGAARLVLVKAPGARGPDLVDAHFALALPPSVRVDVVAADHLDHLRAVLAQAPEADRSRSGDH
jgi:aspartokinase-like uncharacterized kinase